MHRHLFHDNVPLKLGNKLNIDDKQNQSVEKVGVAFVKGANERNEFFEKK